MHESVGLPEAHHEHGDNPFVVPVSVTISIPEIGLVICSVTLLTKRRAFWFGGMLIGLAGVGLAITGFLLH
jgi:hypothetical protein